MNDKTPSALDDVLAARESQWWDLFYADRAKPVPFFSTSPDENLSRWMSEGRIAQGHALELGCGNGRNAVFLAQHGFTVDAVDYSETAIAWAREHTHQARVAVQLHCQSVFELNIAPQSYELVYDSGCFHHIAPHRRAMYVDLVANALKSGGQFAMTCFRPEGGSGLTDEQVYERGTLGGGLGYTDERLRDIWSTHFQIESVRQMEKPSADSGLFGETFLWVMLAQKR